VGASGAGEASTCARGSASLARLAKRSPGICSKDGRSTGRRSPSSGAIPGRTLRGPSGGPMARPWRREPWWQRRLIGRKKQRWLAAGRSWSSSGLFWSRLGWRPVGR
jgi:hypothetical protein